MTYPEAVDAGKRREGIGVRADSRFEPCAMRLQGLALKSVFQTDDVIRLDGRVGRAGDRVVIHRRLGFWASVSRDLAVEHERAAEPDERLRGVLVYAKS